METLLELFNENEAYNIKSDRFQKISIYDENLLEYKELNRMIDDLLSLYEIYLQNNDLYITLSSKQKRKFSIDPDILKQYKKFKFTTS